MKCEDYWKLRRRCGSAWFRATHYKLPKPFLDSGSLFIHVPKAAGISVCTAIYGAEVGHRSIRDYEAIDRFSMGELFKFTVVRDPIQRFVSAYNFLKSGGMASYPADRGFARCALSRYKNINHFAENWLNPDSIGSYHHFVPQIEFLKNRQGELGVDFLARLENIESDFEQITKRLGLNVTLPRANVTVYPCKDTDLGNLAVSNIKRVYSEDFEKLGYG